jgi:hypothetical protein
LILSSATLVSLFLPWAVQVSGYSIGPWKVYLGISLPFPNNLLIALSGIMGVVFSLLSGRLNNLVQGIEMVFSGVALIPPMLFTVTLPRTPNTPSFELCFGFYAGVIVYALLMAQAFSLIYNYFFEKYTLP